MKIVPKNWRDFQHYKDRSPPWIRLHRKLLDDKDFHRLPVASRALAPMLWLLASESVDGQIDADPDNLAFRLRSSEKEIVTALQPLIDKGFFEVIEGDSKPLADCLQHAVPETEALQRQRQSRERRATRLPEDWKLPDDWKSWALKERPDLVPERIAERFSDYWRAKPGKAGTKLDWEATWRNWVREERSSQPVRRIVEPTRPLLDADEQVRIA